MRIPNFKTEEGTILYKNTVGRLISPRVADVLRVHAMEYLAKTNVRKILDLGCGPGTLSIPLAVEYPHIDVIGVDSSESMLAIAKVEAAKQHAQNVTFLKMDAGHISIDPESFDFVLCNLAFPFFPNPYESMREVNTVVRPGGHVYFTVPGRHTWDEFFKVATSVLGDMISMATPLITKFSQAEVLPEAIAAAGFNCISEVRTLIPFQFGNGHEVLEFFGELFHLLDYATPGIKDELVEAINKTHPHGFTMNYEVVLLTAQRP